MPLSISYALKLRGKTRISSRPSSHQSSIHNSQINQNSFIPNSSTISLQLDRRNSNMPLMYCALGTRDNLDGCEEFLPEDIVHLTLTIEKGVDDGTFKMEIYYQDVSLNTNSNNSLPSNTFI